MANQLFPKGREGFLTGAVAWSADDIRVVLTNSTYVFSTVHDFLDDVIAGGRVSTSGALTGKTATDGVADSNDVTYTALASGSTITGVIVYKHTGVETTSRLLAWYDTKADATAISVATNGGDVIVQWSNGANRMFKL